MKNKSIKNLAIAALYPLFHSAGNYPAGRVPKVVRFLPERRAGGVGEGGRAGGNRNHTETFVRPATAERHETDGC